MYRNTITGATTSNNGTPLVGGDLPNPYKGGKDHFVSAKFGANRITVNSSGIWVNGALKGFTLCSVAIKLGFAD